MKREKKQVKKELKEEESETAAANQTLFLQLKDVTETSLNIVDEVF